MGETTSRRRLGVKGRPLVSTLAYILMVAVTPRPAMAASFDHSAYEAVLKQHVDEAGLVDYNGLAKDERFHGYISTLKGADPSQLSRDGQMAFWINAYNALTLFHVMDTKPSKSVRETGIPGLWTSTAFFRDKLPVAGKRMSLDEIEKAILKPEFQDPRIHFALVCASRGCPPLPRFAYTEENVQGKLEDETRKYLNSPRGTRIDLKENVLYVSKLFDWYREDFVRKSGSIEDFIRLYLEQDAATFLDLKPKLDFLPYDWSLNAQTPLE